MDEKDPSASSLLEEIWMISEDNEDGISMDAEEWVTVSKRDHALIIFAVERNPASNASVNFSTTQNNEQDN